jgi:hypothetical protein
MTGTAKSSGQQALAPPRGAAIAGVIFSVLMIVSLGLVRYAMPADLTVPDPWLDEPERRRAIGVALDLVPFAGIAFLWFVGVLRNRLGELEDQFFATVFLGSGLVFVASLFGVAAVLHALVQALAAGKIGSDTYYFGQRVSDALFNVFAVKMAGVFIIATCTIGYDQLIAEMDDRLHFPGLSNSWTMPVENRLDMELTGIKTPVGLKVQGPDVDRIQQIGSQIEEILGSVPGTRGIFAERVAQGFYINIDVDRAVAARYGLTVGDVQRAVSSGMGGENIATTVEGRERYSINVRYLADYRNDLNALRRILIMTPSGAQIPLGEVARITLSPGPSMIRDEDGLLTGYVYIDLATTDYGIYVGNAQRVLDRQLHLPQEIR